MSSAPLDVNAAARLAQHVQLQSIACVGLAAAHISLITPAPVQSLGWEFPDPTATWHLEKNQLRALFPLSLTVTVTRRGEEPARLSEFSATFAVEYEVESLSPDVQKDIPHYVGITGLLHVWPYFRAEIQALTTKLGLPPLTLPVIVSGQASKIVSVVPAKDLPSRVVTRRAKPTTKRRRGLGSKAR